MKAPSANRRVVVTGLGTVNPLGNDPDGTWEKILVGKSGIGRITNFDPSDHKTKIGGEVKDFDPVALFGRKEARRMDRMTQFGLAAAAQAITDAKLETLAPEVTRKVGVVMGNGMGGIDTSTTSAKVLFDRGASRVSPFFVPMVLPDSAAAHISMAYGFCGSNMSINTACASGTNAVGEAARMVAAGVSDVMITGGAEAAVTPLSLAGFDVMGAMSTTWNDEPERACRPFDKDRNGFIVAEGSAVLVLEELSHAQARGAKIYGEILGYGSSADAYHLTAPREDAGGAIQAIEAALEESELDKTQINYINAHGTSTTLNDRMETVAVKFVFGEHAYDLCISSTKSMHGHLLGAAGALEVLVCLKAIEAQILPPTINYETPDPILDLDYVTNEARPSEINYIMSNSFGIGGHNASIIAGRFRG